MIDTITIKLLKDNTNILPYHVALYYDKCCVYTKICDTLEEAQQIIWNLYTQEILSTVFDKHLEPHVKTTITA